MTTSAKADFEALDVASLLCGIEQTSYQFSRVFWSRATDAEGAGDQGRSSLLFMLADICSYGLRPDTPRDPFGPFAVWEDKRTASIDDLDDQQLSLLDDILELVQIPELRARLADVLFVRRKHQRFARIAIDAYLASAALFVPTDWHETTLRLERAHALANIVRSERDKVVEHLTRQLDSHRGDATFFSAKIMQTLVDYRSGDPKHMAELSHAAATRAKADGDWHRAREYLLLLARWRRKLGETDAELEALRDAAECYVHLADLTRSSLVQASHLERAVQSLRSIPGSHARIDELHARILCAGKAAIEEFKAVDQSIDLSASQDAARDALRGLSLDDAIVRMATIWRLRPTKNLRDRALDLARRSVFANLIHRTIVNRQGKVVARRGPIIGGDPEKQEGAIRQAMFEQAAQDRDLIAMSVLRPARAQLAEEHYVSGRTLLPLTSRSAFVPRGRAELFAEGLAAGFNGDFATALNILVPQIENSIRVLLDQNGVITSKIDSDGIQEERDLGTLLYLPETEQIFGGELIFEMQGLLVERCGSNLRNLLAHGLLEVDRCVDGQSVYLWWLTLFLVVMPLLNTDPQTAAEEPETTEGPGEAPASTDPVARVT